MRPKPTCKEEKKPVKSGNLPRKCEVNIPKHNKTPIGAIVKGKKKPDFSAMFDR